MNGSAADRLRRLRWVLTALFTTMNAIGLIVLAWIVVNEDADRGTAAVTASLDRVTSSVSRLV
ncbi:sensor histidine kinase, partial [Amycolatopsis sp. NPDC000673]